MPKIHALRPFLLFGFFLLFCALGIATQPVWSQASAISTPSFATLPTWGTDINLSHEPLCPPPSPKGDSPAAGWQNEKNLSLAVSPTNRNFIVGGYELYGGFDDTHSRYIASTDGGITWQGGCFPDHYLGDLEMRNDSLVAFDSQGTAYYSALALGGTTSGYLVFTSTDGLTWKGPAPIVIADYSEYRYLGDLTIDQNAAGSEPYAGSLYFASPFYHNVAPYDQGLHMRYSRDKGVTWSSDVAVSDPGNDYNYRPSIKTASDGTVYIGFTDVISGSILNPPQLFFDRSTDGGQTWGQDHMVTGAPITPIGAPDWKFHELTLVSDANCDLLRINHNPIIGVSPTNPEEVYMVWNDGRWDLVEDLCSRPNAHHSDIAFSRSTDGGITWSAPLRVNDDPMGNGVDQWQPSMDVAPDGTIGVSWYDRRYSTNHYYYDVAYSQSTDGGLTWSANQRVSDQSSDPTQLADAKGIDDLGFRQAMVFGLDLVLPTWIDTRDSATEGHLYMDRGLFNPPTPGPSPTVTPSPMATAPETSTSTSTPAPVTSTPTAPPAPSSTMALTSTSTSTATSTVTSGATATAAASPTECTISFSDVPEGSTFYTYIHCLACLDIINGYPDGTFKPNNAITRGQLSKVVSNSAGFDDTPVGQQYQDVPQGSTFYQYIYRLSSRGYISGYPCGGPGEPCEAGNLPYFRPNANSTRGQISKIVSNAAGFSERPVGQQFEDVPQGSTFYTYTYRLVLRDVMQGYACGDPGEQCVPPSDMPYFRPNSNATRGQVSKIVANTFFPDCAP